jgi:hypothetical protein
MSATFQYTVTLPQSAKPHLADPEKETKQLIAMDLYKKGGVSGAWAAAVASPCGRQRCPVVCGNQRHSLHR